MNSPRLYGGSVTELATPFFLARRAYRPISFHYWMTLIMVAALAPALRMAGLPFRFTWVELFRDYWGFLVSESIIGGILLYVAGVPIANSLSPLCRRYSRQK